MIRPLAALSATTAVVLAMPAMAQDHSMDGMNMPGMTMPAKKPAAQKPAVRKPPPKKPARRSAPARVPAAPDMRTTGHSAMPGMATPDASSADKNTEPAMDHETMPGMDMSDDQAGRKMGGMQGMEMTGTALPAGNAPAPKPPTDHYADRQFPSAEMERSRMQMMREQGGQSLYQVMFNLAEYQARQGRDGYRWDGEAWFGGDIHRLTIKTEGEGAFREGVETAEIQALYSRAIGPYFNLQAGVRHDFQPSPTRTYATIGIEGLAPYWFEVEAAAFLSNKGDLLGRLEGYYDQRLTQRLVLQPRVELNLAAQDVPENRIGAGLVDAELGLRLRYEITRQFAPYVGISYEAKTGRTADFARADGQDPATTSFVAGVRLWF